MGLRFIINLKPSGKIIINVDGLAEAPHLLLRWQRDELIMNTGSMLMIHEASTWTWGQN